MGEDEEIPHDAVEIEDDEYSTSDDGTSTDAPPMVETPKEPEELKMVESETNKIRILRPLLVIATLLIGVVVTTVTYLWLQEDAEKKSSTAFVFFANSVSETFMFNMASAISKTNALRRGISSAAIEHGGKFPFFTIPYFEVKAFGTRHEAKFETVAFAPIVKHSELEQYLDFSNRTRDWLEESKMIFDKLLPGLNRTSEPPVNQYPPSLLCVDHKEDKKDYSKILLAPCFVQSDSYLPLLQISPPPFANQTFNNINFLSDPTYETIIEAASQVKNVVFSQIDLDPHVFDFVYGSEIHSSIHTHPHTLAALAVFDGLSGGNVVGYLFGVIGWDKYMKGLLPPGVTGVVLVLRNSCGQSFTYMLHGSEVEFLGLGDLHDSKYDGDKVTANLADSYPDKSLLENTAGHCVVSIDIYSSDTFQESYSSNVPMIVALVAALVFVFKACLFGLYDLIVQSRNQKVTTAALRSNAIVSSMFPESVKERLLAARESQSNERDENGMFKGKPIADLYPEATVLFADIVGFSAWSSMREPSQVLSLLETLYSAFDKIADQRRIYKVETIGDCYVAVCGLPQPRKDHAVAMARFARDCMYKIWSLTKALEASLGPDTGDLTLRIGLHSGPVTAGVLRGERSRFQLFGDTYNTAARMEGTGQASCIQLSQATADLLIAAGKSKWIKPRENHVYAKGKGQMKTFFLEIKQTLSSDEGSSHREHKDISVSPCDEILDKNTRQIDWNFEVLSRLLKQIIASRKTLPGANDRKPIGYNCDECFKHGRVHPFDEVAEIIEMPNYQRGAKNKEDIDSIVIDPQVAGQLRDLLQKISSMYRENPFHNFEHASHVTMSVTKLLSRIVAPSDLDFGSDRKVNAKSLHDHTYGITSCPLTQFAVVFSAIIHDVDHPGVPNAQLVKEGASLAETYKNVSVAEQNSVDLALELLSSDHYKELRHTIAATKDEMLRFRQLVINVVMATDICDKQLKDLRNNRWNRAFSQDAPVDESPDQARNRKATIVIEHLIQASDIAHTMQHWHIYRKWNERFFMECYAAYKNGRAETDPSTNWYKGEIGFFDFYIIPLARKLKECGVFGVSSAEYLNYAEKNRQEWVDRGEEVVSEMIEKARKFWEPKATVARGA